jgi:hypothetical protein
MILTIPHITLILIVRLHQLVSRYHDVDPGEHRLLQTKYAEAEKAVADTQAAMQTMKETVRTNMMTVILPLFRLFGQ